MKQLIGIIKTDLKGNVEKEVAESNGTKSIAESEKAINEIMAEEATVKLFPINNREEMMAFFKKN